MQPQTSRRRFVPGLHRLRTALSAVLLVVVGTLAVWIVASSGGPTGLVLSALAPGHRVTAAEDAERRASILAEVAEDARRAVAEQEQAERDGTAPTEPPPVPPVDVNAAVVAAVEEPAPAAGLAHTVSNMYLLGALGPYNLAEACAASVRFLASASVGIGNTSEASSSSFSSSSSSSSSSSAGVLDGPHPLHPLYGALERARDPATNTVVIAFASMQYHKVVRNWLLHMRKLAVPGVLMLALDTPSSHVLGVEPGITSMLLVPGEAMDRSRVPVFMLRYHVFTYALCAGVNVVMSDVDAIWLHNPLPTYMLDTPFDCVFSGDNMPGEIRTKWNISTALCFGLFFCRANERSLALAAVGQPFLAKGQDDQRALNYGLDTLGIAAPGFVPDRALPASSGGLGGGSGSASVGAHGPDIYAYFERSFRGTTTDPSQLVFNILSRSLVTRHCGPSFHASTWPGQIAHCMIKQPALDQEETLRLKGLWRTGA